ncbi:MAG: fused MFS/spermidine synthase [Planctomycetes bacterium]|nr:fused MFS/spermidine synthase [Planctomycetota bacterium]
MTRFSLSRSNLVFIVTVFLSAFLLFQIQPLISKTILPWFGGTPSVWTTCMLFFQVLLFAGYWYAHLISERFTPSKQMIIHILLMVTALLVLPVTPNENWKPTGHEEPTLRIVFLLTLSVGLPFFILSSTGPLLQRWFSRTEQGKSPYRLYAVSNAGSLLALISYPFVFEPAFSAVMQAKIWSWCFRGFIVLCSACAIRLWWTASPQVSAGVGTQESDSSGDSLPRIGMRVMWFGLAMAASVMLLATTNQVCLDVAAVPFLWVLPLTLYLFSFILCFDSDQWYSRRLFMLALAVSTATVVIVMLKGAGGSIVTQVLVYFSGLFFCAMVCHGELARLRPHPRYLTSFYLIVAAGGAAGGVFVGIISPLVFPMYFELHVGLLACCVFAVAAVVLDRRNVSLEGKPSWVWVPVLLGLLGLSTALKVHASEELNHAVSVSRNFYGVLRVQEMHSDDPQRHHFRMMHGRIIHGLQFTSNEKKLEPTTYYARESGIGLLLDPSTAKEPRRIGIVGLGVGTLAVYANPKDVVRFYEINPDVIRLAKQHFSFLEECRGDIEIVTGDARLSLEHEPAQNYDVLVLDAFSGDAIPAHLLTEEAFEIYLKHLKPDGVFAMHISNLHFDLRPVMAGLADRFGFSTVGVLSNKDESKQTNRCFWLLMSRNAMSLEGVKSHQSASQNSLPQTDRRILWTDDRSNLFEILR